MAQQLQQQLWNIANDLRGKMGADEFRDLITTYATDVANFKTEQNGLDLKN